MRKKVKKKLAIILNCAILIPVMRDNPHTMSELNSQKFMAEVESLVSDEVRQYCDVEGAVEWAMRNDWSVEDCVKYLEE
tara:strand:- start:392 stop:628 length:237 start_codon:yes stop_codon:yes gene_type:complete